MMAVSSSNGENEILAPQETVLDAENVMQSH
jgi:hypothetical protein